jgi:hypothetical protein
MELYLIIGLGCLNVFQFFFWSLEVHRLIDKLMSKNYAEYISVKKPQLPVVFEQDPDSIDEQDVLKELNGAFS